MTLRQYVCMAGMVFALMLPFSAVADTAAETPDESTGTATEVDGGMADDPAGEEVAGDDGVNGDESYVEEPSYGNAAQAMHAANLAAAAAMQPDPAVTEAAEALQDARDAYDAASEAVAADPENPDALAALEQAEQDLDLAREEYAGKVSELTGVVAAEIATMRIQERMGWGQIAHELGVHPSTLGLGHSKKTALLDPVDGLDDDLAAADDGMDPAAEMAEATRRDVHNGWSKGHGLQTSTDKSSKKGLGLSETSVAAGTVASGSTKAGKSQGVGSSARSDKSSAGRGADGSPSAGTSAGNNGRGADKGDKGNNGKGNSDKGNNGKGNSKK